MWLTGAVRKMHAHAQEWRLAGKTPPPNTARVRVGGEFPRWVTTGGLLHIGTFDRTSAQHYPTTGNRFYRTGSGYGLHMSDRELSLSTIIFKLKFTYDHTPRAQRAGALTPSREWAR